MCEMNYDYAILKCAWAEIVTGKDLYATQLFIASKDEHKKGGGEHEELLSQIDHKLKMFTHNITSQLDDIKNLLKQKK